MFAHKHIPLRRSLSDFIEEVYCQECGEILGVGFTIIQTFDKGIEKKWELGRLPKKRTVLPKKIRGKVRKLSFAEKLKLA